MIEEEEFKLWRSVQKERVEELKENMEERGEPEVSCAQRERSRRKTTVTA